MKKSKLAKVVYYLLIIMLVGGIVCLFFIPVLYNYYRGARVLSFLHHSLIYVIAFYTCYIIALAIIGILTKLFKTIYEGSPFTIKVEKHLKICALLFIVLTIIIGIKTIFIPTLLSLVVVIVTLLAGLSFYVLASVIKAAIAYKSELDYTV